MIGPDGVSTMSVYDKIARNSIYKKSRKRRRKDKHVDRREKGDFFVERQMQVFRQLEEVYSKAFLRDFKKYNIWIDIADTENNIAVIIRTEDGQDKKIETQLHKNGWSVVFVSYSYKDIKSITDAIEKVTFLRSKRDFLKKAAAQLEGNLPKSEVWYREKIEKESFYSQLKFEFNKPLFNNFIYDLYSRDYRLCIEVDGSIHSLPEVQTKDQRKTYITKKKGFNIIRVVAFDEDSYNQSITLIKEHLNTYNNPNKLNSSDAIKTTSDNLGKTGKLGF